MKKLVPLGLLLAIVAGVSILSSPVATNGQSAGLVSSVLNRMERNRQSLKSLKATTHDRGSAGPDLVDYLDQWLCSGFSVWEATAGNNFRGLVASLNQFPYAPVSPMTCN